ncbi:PTS system, glucose-specific IIA component [hydrothermal vent metagenome]|uniref:PTS system, glucose-specific IIA component n=1 Tax=hydrothermal vent metagenome TaxID=652676 RepID=A0A1W1CUN9_9ZZZZ
MFGLFKAKKQTIVSPADGDIVKLSEVPDQVFSEKMAGDGIAIVPRSNTFVAPISGVVSKIFSTNHAYSIKAKNGLEVLVHIGLETVALKGEGFKRLVEEGTKVSVGKPIISADLEYIQAQGKNIITPIVLNHDKELILESHNTRTVREGELLIEVTVK